MEIEAKFSFREQNGKPDEAAFERWRARAALGPFVLGAERLLRLTDTYLDTAAHACRAAGYACRVRIEGGRAVATLKSLDDQAQGDDGVRRRDEQETELTAPPGAASTDSLAPGERAPDWQQPNAWPDGPARTLALRLCGDKALLALATLRQERHERPLRDGGGRVVAAFTLDRVNFSDGAPPALELECELAPAGTEADMAQLVAALRAEADFTPQPRSKLQRALQGIDLPAHAAAAQNQSEPAHEPPATARNEPSPARPARDQIEPSPQQRRPGEAEPAGEPLALLALGLAAATPDAPAERARLLERALALLAEGRAADPATPAATARDIVRAAPRADLDERERALLAGALALLALLDERARSDAPARHLGHKRARALPEVAALDSSAFAQARALAVLLHQARALAAAGGERVVASVVREDAACVYLAGDLALDGSLGKHGAALWRETFAADLTLAADDDARKVAGLRYDQPLAAAGRRILAAQLARLSESLDALRADADIEALHDARVAARRMRTAFQLLDDAFPSREARPLEKGLRGLAAALGTVRDLDVLIEHVRDDARDHGEEAALAPVLARMDERRTQARRALLARLDGPDHAAWLAALRAFLDGASRGRTGNRRVCDAVPALLWRRYAHVRVYAPELRAASDARLHELRKDVRRLRYALEFFQELLAEDAAVLVRRAVALQDALGALHDAVVLRETLERYEAPEPAALRALAALSRRRAEALAGWPQLAGERFRACLGAACAAL